MGAREDVEEAIVRDVGERFGYGRTMQLCEHLWSRKLAAAGMSGGEHSVGPCVALLVACPHLERDENDHCNWCCGSGRVTQRVLKAQIEAVK